MQLEDISKSLIICRAGAFSTHQTQEKNLSGLSCRNHSQSIQNEVSWLPDTYFTSNQARSGGRNSRPRTVVQGSGLYLSLMISRYDAICDTRLKVVPKLMSQVNHRSVNLFWHRITSTSSPPSSHIRKSFISEI